MARRRYRKSYRRPKGRWCSNIKNVNKTATYTITAAQQVAGGTLWMSDLLAENPAQADNTVSQIYTVKNFDISFFLEYDCNSPTTTGFLDGFACYIVYVPQGFTVNNEIINTHPEWIMAMRYVGEPKNDTTEQQQFLPFRIRSRMARKLNTGDGIYFLAVGRRDPIQVATTTITLNLDTKGLVRWWTKAN